MLIDLYLFLILWWIYRIMYAKDNLYFLEKNIKLIYSTQ